jgi:hypothetical protein
MKSFTTSRFRRDYAALSPEMQQKAQKAFRLWQSDPGHPSLRFEAKGNFWTARIDRGWRVIGRREGDTVYWLAILPHDDYERFLKER